MQTDDKTSDAPRRYTVEDFFAEARAKNLTVFDLFPQVIRRLAEQGDADATAALARSEQAGHSTALAESDIDNIVKWPLRMFDTPEEVARAVARATAKCMQAKLNEASRSLASASPSTTGGAEEAAPRAEAAVRFANSMLRDTRREADTYKAALVKIRRLAGPGEIADVAAEALQLPGAPDSPAERALFEAWRGSQAEPADPTTEARDWQVWQGARSLRAVAASHAPREFQDTDYLDQGIPKTVTLSPAEINALTVLAGHELIRDCLRINYGGDRSKDGRDSIEGWVQEFWSAVQKMQSLANRVNTYEAAVPQAQQAQSTATRPSLTTSPDVETLLAWAVEDGVIRLSQVFDADLQDALTRFARRLRRLPA